MELLMEWLSTATVVEQTMRRMQITTEEFAQEMEKREILVVVLVCAMCWTGLYS